jgi:hypothetical protein
VIGSFSEWWHKPVTVRHRVLAASIGAFGGFWVGLLGRLLLGPMPIEFSTLVYWSVGGILLGIAAGLVFPRAITIILFPFSTIGGN